MNFRFKIHRWFIILVPHDRGWGCRCSTAVMLTILLQLSRSSAAWRTTDQSILGSYHLFICLRFRLHPPKVSWRMFVAMHMDRVTCHYHSNFLLLMSSFIPMLLWIRFLTFSVYTLYWGSFDSISSLGLDPDFGDFCFATRFHKPTGRRHRWENPGVWYLILERCSCFMRSLYCI